MSLRLPLLALVCLLAACEPEPDADATAATSDRIAEADPMMDNTMDEGPVDTTEVTPQGTLGAVPTEGLTSMAPSAAFTNIDDWIGRLDGAAFTNAPEIREGLMALRNQLQEDPLDGSAIGETLVDLGTWTSEAAGDDEALRQLGAALTSAGETLAGESM